MEDHSSECDGPRPTEPHFTASLFGDSANRKMELPTFALKFNQAADSSWTELNRKLVSKKPSCIDYVTTILSVMYHPRYHETEYWLHGVCTYPYFHSITSSSHVTQFSSEQNGTRGRSGGVPTLQRMHGLLSLNLTRLWGKKSLVVM